MLTRMIAAAALALAVAPVAVVAAPSAEAAACSPSITMDKPFQDPGGFVVFPASFSLCEDSKVTVKFSDRDAPDVAGSGSSVRPAGPGSTYSGTCSPDGDQHRWVAYATVKTATGGTLLAQTPKVYFTSKPVFRNCAPYPPEPCTPTISSGQPFQDASGFVTFSASFTLCQQSLVSIKFRDRDTTNGWGGGSGTEPFGPGSTYAGNCHPDGKAHRWVAYATVKTQTGGILLAQSDKVYFNAQPVTSCGTWTPPTG